MKIYKCKICGKGGTREETRKCLMKHMGTDKKTRESKRTGSRITARMERYEI